MVNRDGKSTMLGHWRITLRQAEDAAKAGRYDEAIALLARPDVAGHHHAAQLRSKLALDLVARAGRRAESDDLAGGIDDLRLAETLGAGPDTLAAARLTLADRVAGEVRLDLEAGDPSRVVERIDDLAKSKITGPALRRLREVAEAWRVALDESRRGEFGRAHDALTRAERFAGEVARPALADAQADLDARHKSANPKVEALYQALASGRSPEILAAAEAVLEVVPEHPAARQARTKAWQQIAAIGPATGGLPQRAPRIIPAGLGLDPEPNAGFIPQARTQRVDDGGPKTLRIPGHMPPQTAGTGRALAQAKPPGPSGRFLLWVDSIGGYLVCLDDRITLGRAGGDATADVPLLGDLARNHAALLRDGDGYILQAVQPSFVNGQAVEAAAALRDGDIIRLGSTVELEFRQPSPVSSTARLEILSRHRLPLAVDGVILMAETCIVGPKDQAHIPAPQMADSVVLYRQGNALAMRAPGAFEVDGRACAGRSPITLQSSVLGDGFSFSLEPLGSKSSPC